MDTGEALSTYIKKLSHPLKEIRERSLQLLIAKLQLGWSLNEELTRNRELLQALITWFDVKQPTMQKEALELLLSIIKTKGGSYAAREYNIRKILEILYKNKSKIDSDAIEVYEDIVETLKFINTVESNDNLNVPRLNIPSSSSISSENGASYNDQLYSSVNKQSSEHTDSNEDMKYSTGSHMSQAKTFCCSMIASACTVLGMLGRQKSCWGVSPGEREIVWFIKDVFLCDFPPEIFLNRPSIVKGLLAISDGQYGSAPGESLNVLLYLTKALHKRLKQLFSPDLVCEHSKILIDNRDSYDLMNAELEELVGRTGTPLEDKLAALRQLPAPVYALDTMHTILCMMVKSVVLIETDGKEVLTMREHSVCLSLIEALVAFLLDCVDENFWKTDHSSKTQRNIAHKSCMAMRMLGELVSKYHDSYQTDPERVQHRVAWFRLLSCASSLLNWTRNSPLPPTSLLNSLQTSLLDPGVDILYPELNKKIYSVLKNAKSSVDQEFKSRYRELRKLYSSMDHAVSFMKANGRITKDILPCVKNSIPVLQIHRNEGLLSDMADIIMGRDLNFDEKDWSEARSIALSLMAHPTPWIQIQFYQKLVDLVKSVLTDESDKENDLTLLCDVTILTEICCHGLSSSQAEVEEGASDIMLYLLRGRLVLSEKCWWRLLASLLPVLPLLHVYAAHETQLGKAICKSLEVDIVECMGVSQAEMVWGLVRLLFVKCPAVQMYAAHSLCGVLDDSKYLPPQETLRTDILINALRRVEVLDFNIDHASSPTKKTQTTGLVQLLEVLKQDLVLDDTEYLATIRVNSQPTLEPSLRRSTLQQLAVLMRQQDQHDAFIRHDGVKLIGALLRMSLTVDDYLAFPECAISCVSVLNSVCFVARHALSKLCDLPLFLIRAILVFPANESHVTMAAQVLGLLGWAGFVLQELDSSRRRVPALPLSVVERVSLPFAVNTYWPTSPNAEHGSVEWLLNDTAWRTAIRVRWWWLLSGGTKQRGVHLLQANRGASPPSTHDLELLRSACADYSCSKALLNLENATSHTQVNEALYVLESYARVMQSATVCPEEFGNLKWQNLKRFLTAPPASSRDTQLLVTLLQFVIAYMDNVPNIESTMSWIKSSFIGEEATIISLLGRDRLYPQQSSSEDVEVTQLRIHIVKVFLRCIMMLEELDDYSSPRMESLLKILFACLERIDLKNFHMLGYLNELLRCIRYGLHSRFCDLTEETIINSLRVLTRVLTGCASGAGRKGQSCRLDTMLGLMAVLKRIRSINLPVQRWSEYCDGALTESVVRCATAQRPELRAASLHITAALANYAQLTPQLEQYIPNESLCRYAVEIFSKTGEANVVRSAALVLLTAVTARVSSHNQTFAAIFTNFKLYPLDMMKCRGFFFELLENLEFSTSQ
ncbi:unnamed protein product [Leptosia nina]|uniref:Rotatin N-terminal domain-containing protein n=1 Tax=Leptosia nina TaxID=320188 RepID=A0AAV1JBB1_9NEOP